MKSNTFIEKGLEESTQNYYWFSLDGRIGMTVFGFFFLATRGGLQDLSPPDQGLNLGHSSESIKS